MSDLDRLRTVLANERTLLAYIRTSLALLIFGMAAVKFFPDVSIIIFLGWAFMICGISILMWGIFHFRTISRLIREE